ncbi:uncharacterized protein LOC122514288 [Polistes fuscatus]|uniref:uncharacterized protein LOC122514288 n=1 Tax=Polistes fuscatus TaxID=30207 RepID=UPI001CA7FD53|nr:uncharacterized protein LOC122514288 [Polistes fuscatus]
MGKSCYLCDRKASKTDNISLHRFPKDLTLRQKWLNVCGLSLDDNVSYTYICSIHFAETDIYKSNTLGRSRSSIKSGVVPSMFITNPLVIQEKVDDLSSKALRNVIINDNFVKCKHILSNIENNVEVPDKNCNSSLTTYESFASKCSDANDIAPNDDDPGYSISKKQRRFFEPRYISDITEADFATPARASKAIKLIKATDRQNSKQIESLQIQTRILKNRIRSLENLLSQLKDKIMTFKESGDNLEII